MSRIARFLKRLAADNIQVETRRVPAVSMLFYDDGTSEIMSRQGFALTHAQQLAIREFEMDQMFLALEQFERTRQKAAATLPDKVRLFPLSGSREIN